MNVTPRIGNTIFTMLLQALMTRVRLSRIGAGAGNAALLETDTRFAPA